MGGGSNEAAASSRRAAEKTKRLEDKRQRQIGKGQENIDRAFAGFNDAYYNKFKDDYTGYYFPQIDREYRDTNSKLSTGLLEKGLGESSVGAASLGDLFRKYGEERTNVSNQAADEANKLRQNVERTKSDLFTLNLASADPQGIMARATGEASSLVAPQAYTPIGSIFASALQPLTYGAAAYGNRPAAPYPSPYSVASGSGSGKVIS